MSKVELDPYQINWSVEFVQRMPDETFDEGGYMGAFRRISPNAHRAEGLKVTWHTQDTFQYMTLTNTFNFTDDQALLVKINEDHIQIAKEVFKLRFKGNLDPEKTYRSHLMSDQIGSPVFSGDGRELYENQGQSLDKKDDKSTHPATLAGYVRLVDHCSFPMGRCDFERKLLKLETLQRDRIRVGLRSNDPNNLTKEMKVATLLKRIGGVSSTLLLVFTVVVFGPIGALFIAAGSYFASGVALVVVPVALLVAAFVAFVVGRAKCKEVKPKQDDLIDEKRKAIVANFTISKHTVFKRAPNLPQASLASMPVCMKSIGPNGESVRQSGSYTLLGGGRATFTRDDGVSSTGTFISAAELGAMTGQQRREAFGLSKP